VGVQVRVLTNVRRLLLLLLLVLLLLLCAETLDELLVRFEDRIDGRSGPAPCRLLSSATEYPPLILGYLLAGYPRGGHLEMTRSVVVRHVPVRRGQSNLGKAGALVFVQRPCRVGTLSPPRGPGSTRGGRVLRRHSGKEEASL